VAPRRASTHRTIEYSVANVRVSSEEQAAGDRWSLSAQRQEIERYCQQRGWRLVKIYSDEGHSAKGSDLNKRPAFKQMLADLREGRVRADVIVTHTLDRYARNLVVALTTLAEMHALGVTYSSVTESDFDYSDPDRRTHLQMLAVFAEYFSEKLSQHTRKGKRERARQGYYNGQLPYGYANPAEGHSGAYNKTVPVLVEEEIAWYIKARDWYRPSTGPSTPEGEAASFQEVANRLNGGGSRVRNHWAGKERWARRNPHRLWTADTVAHMLQSKFYCGLVAYKGEWIPGQHPAVSTEAMIREITAKARANRSGRLAAAVPSGRVYLLNRRLFCRACGEPLRVQPTGKGTKVRFVCTAPSRGLTCSAGKRSIDQAVLERQIAGLIGAVRLPPTYQEEALTLLGEVDPESEEAAIQARREALLAELERCKHAFKLGVSDQAEFDADVRRIRHELEGLPVVSTVEERRLSLEEVARYLEDVRTLWAAATRPEQRALAQTLFRAVHVDLDAQAIVRADLPPQFRDLLPFIGVEMTGEDLAATGTDTPVAQGAHGSMFGRNRRDSTTHYDNALRSSGTTRSLTRS
jgi:site-specific DNA recombinase